MPSCKPGQVFRLYCSWFGKDKYLVYLGNSDDGDPFFFYISSARYRLVLDNPEMLVQQLIMFKSRHNFLDYDSWVNCAEVCRRFSWSEIDYLLTQQNGQIVGSLHSTLKTEIQRVVSSSETLSTYEQRIICENLSDES